MKKLIAAAVTSVVLVAAMAPAFAAPAQNCAFKDASLCEKWTDSLSPTTGS